jgi:hypothetical protein
MAISDLKQMSQTSRLFRLILMDHFVFMLNRVWISSLMFKGYFRRQEPCDLRQQIQVASWIPEPGGPEHACG